MTSPDHAIEVRGISKSYPTGFWRRRVTVLSDLSFSVGRNEIVGFLGPNGAGKTTTIKIITRLGFPDAGTVSLFGSGDWSRPEIRRQMGFMPEQPYFYEYLTGEEFLALCGHLNGVPREEIADRSRAILSRVGIGDAGKTAIRKYSKGMMQRLGLAQALLHDPELVILDEPMSGLDPLGRMEVRNLIREMKEAGKTVFFSSHIISDVEALCDRVIMLHKGRKVAEGTVEELMGKEGIRYVELLFSPVPAQEWLSRVDFSQEGRGEIRGAAIVIRAKDFEDADRWIQKFRESGSLLRSCVPVKKRLEDIYVEQVAAHENGDPSRMRGASGGGGRGE
ncbi:MAG TPA: ABC transporter ATP-binding protein [Candidatus Deferrimicrobiaceae bacterium]|nr:ABC transporter ATP-binding protein [Candidatus Deferrimicrobiaceae bacterium]